MPPLPSLPSHLSSLFISNVFRPSSSLLPLTSPSSSLIYSSSSSSSSSDVNQAIQAARKAFDGEWKGWGPSKRGSLLNKLADFIERDGEYLSELEALEIGKPKHIAIKSDIASSAALFRYYAGFADKLHGETIPLNSNHLCFTKKEPVGVCALILPWNFPLPALAVKVAPAIAAGCTVIVKPAEESPVTAMKFAEYVLEAGFPPGVINIIPGKGEVAGNFSPTQQKLFVLNFYFLGQALIESPDVDKIAFTGSTATGLHILRSSTFSSLKRFSFELGGKSPLIILPDADVETAVNTAIGAVFFNTGQICVAGSRLFLPRSLLPSFLSLLRSLLPTKTIGCPFDPNTNFGPLISKAQKDKFLAYVQKGVAEGAKLEYGGRDLSLRTLYDIPGHRDPNGFYVEPAVFSGVEDHMSIAKEEIFGPLMSILTYETVDEVIERANKTNFGLCAGVLGKKTSDLLKISNGLKCGTVWLNCYGYFEPGTPFGGWKDSGLGKEHGREGVESFMVGKTVIMNGD